MDYTHLSFSLHRPNVQPRPRESLWPEAENIHHMTMLAVLSEHVNR